MRTIIAVLLAASIAAAQPTDAPVEERPAQAFVAGSIIPFDGVCMSDGKSIEVGKRIASCEASMSAVEGKTVMSTPVLIGGVVAIVAVSFAAGMAAMFAAKL